MDEQQWLSCTDPTPMLEFLRGKASDRKLRLFACACCRRLWNLLTDQREWKAIEFAERCADGLATTNQLHELGGWGGLYEGPPVVLSHSWDAASLSSDYGIGMALEEEADAVGKAAFRQSWLRGDLPTEAQSAADAGVPAQWLALKENEQKFQSHLLQDLFGFLLFRPVALDLAWRTPTVRALVTAAYEERILPAGTLDTQRLAVLADALEEADCDNAGILSHLRGPGPHVRGCWALDLVLGKS